MVEEIAQALGQGQDPLAPGLAEMKGPGKISVAAHVWWGSRPVELRRKEFVMSDEVRTPDEDEVEAHGQPVPVMCSFDASPVPSATQRRPGNI